MRVFHLVSLTALRVSYLCLKGLDEGLPLGFGRVGQLEQHGVVVDEERVDEVHHQLSLRLDGEGGHHHVHFLLNDTGACLRRFILR